MSEILQSALYYLNHCGFSVIPVGQDKKPLIKWQEFQRRKPTADEVQKWWVDYPNANVGIVTGIISNLCVIDIDSPESENLLFPYIPDSLITPTVQTPRGGKHIYLLCDDPDVLNCTGIFPKIDVRANGGFVVAPLSSNGTGKKYEFLINIKDTPLEKISPALLAIFKKGSTKYRKPQENEFKDFFAKSQRDEDLFHLAYVLIKSGESAQFTTQVVSRVAGTCDTDPSDPLGKDIAIVKVKSAIERCARGERNLTDDFKTWIDFQGEHFELKQAFSDLGLKSREDKQICYVVIGKWIKNGLFERQNRPGYFRKVVTKTIFSDISQAEDLTYLKIRWPLGIESYAAISPKSISVIAGEPEAGKSAFLCNFCNLNMDSHKIYYFSSELTASRFKKRAKTLGRPIEEWKKVLFTDQIQGNFHDVIDPNGVNLIDYMELNPEKVFEVANKMKDIFNKLDKGVAIIALQKKRGAQWAFGQEWTAMKPEFYLTLSVSEKTNIAKIEKAKNWVSDMVNPVGLKKNFKIYKGIQFFPDRKRPDWFKEEGKDPKDYGELL